MRRYPGGRRRAIINLIRLRRAGKSACVHAAAKTEEGTCMDLTLLCAGGLTAFDATLIGTSVVLADVNWIMVASASALSGVLSILTSIAGLPEVKTE